MKVFTDGGCSNNGQLDMTKRKMVAVVADENGTVLVEKTKMKGSSNIAEIWAILEALVFARTCKVEELDLYTDSRIALSWLKGRVGKKLNDRNTVLTILTGISAVRETVKLTTTWISRDDNKAGWYIENSYGL